MLTTGGKDRAGGRGAPSGGTAIAVCNPLATYIKEVKRCNNNLTAILLDAPGNPTTQKRVWIISVYIQPTATAPEIEQIFEQIMELEIDLQKAKPQNGELEKYINITKINLFCKIMV